MARRWALLDAEFPAASVPDAFERERMRHEAYAAPRRRLYLGGEAYVRQLRCLLRAGTPRILVSGASGGGKSALLANALTGFASPKRHLLEHYVGASSDAADPVALVRRIIEHIRRVTGSTEAVPAEPEALFESLPTWLAIASAYAGKHRSRWVFVLDALNGLTAHRDLRWLPGYLPPRVQLVVSCLEGEVKAALEPKGPWETLTIAPLGPEGQQRLLAAYLRRYNKTLPPDLTARALGHPLAGNPLWLKTLAEELRLFGSHEELEARLKTLLGAPPGKAAGEPPSVDDLFEHVLERVGHDHGSELLRDALTALWASRAGLSEPELLAILAKHAPRRRSSLLPPALWAPIRHALDEILLESGGRLVFGHDYAKVAVKDRYLQTPLRQRRAHRALARHFAGQPVDGRVAEELPHQWREAGAWKELGQALTERPMFEALQAHRSDEEHLGYWLSLEAALGRPVMEARLKAAWARWKLPRNKEHTGGVADALATFLRYAGRGLTGAFVPKLAQQALEIEERIQGPDHPNTGTRLNNLAALLKDMGDYTAAEPLCRRALAIDEKALGPKHPETGTSLNNLAGLLYAQGNYAAAEPLFRRALAIAESAQGLEHPETGISLNNLAMVLDAQGDYAAAEPLYRRALAITEKARGPEHPETGTSLNNLAELMTAQGDYAAAEPLCRRALAIAEKAQGPEHPETGTLLNNLAELMSARADYAAAEPLCRRALAIAEKAQGYEHPSTGASLNNLARLLQVQGDYTAAEPLFRRALAIAEKLRGPGHPETGVSLNNLAELLRDQGDYAAAEPLLRRALAIVNATLGPEHPSAGVSLNNLALLLEDQGDYAAAEALYRRALAIAEKAEGPEHPSTGTSLNNLAELLRAQGDCAEAEPLYRRALAIAEKTLGPEHPETGTSLNNLALLLKDKGDYPAAEPLFRRALAIAEKAQGPEHPYSRGLLNKLAAVIEAQGNYAESESLRRRALDVAERIDGPRSEATGAALWSLGLCLVQRGKHAEALSVLERELLVTEGTHGKDPPSAALTHQHIGRLLREVGRLEEAQRRFESALRIHAMQDDPDEETITGLIDDIAHGDVGAGRFEDARRRLSDIEAGLTEGLPGSPKIRGSIESRMDHWGRAQTAVEALVSAGREKGFLLYTDINDLIPDEMTDQTLLEGIVMAVIDAGIACLEDPPAD